MALINGKEIDIHVKGGFSERKGIKKFSDIVQIESLNERTRNKLYNEVDTIFKYMEKKDFKLCNWFIEYIYEELFSLAEKDIPKHSGYYNFSSIFENIYIIFNKEEYYEVFTFLEGLINCFGYIDNRSNYIYNLKDGFKENLKIIFESENVNYRIVDDRIIDIVDKNQIDSINETLDNKYKVVSDHYKKAIEHLYKSKDYDNSIKESISSVEAMCQIITKNDKATLGDAIKIIKRSNPNIHPALLNAFDKIYGYTSDSNGIRHSNGLGEGNSTFEEARYMLISCSAFVNYLEANMEKE